MDDSEFLNRLQSKIERLTGKAISLVIDESEVNKLDVDLDNAIPRVILGAAVFQYPGFARMCTEYAVASIRQGRGMGTLEFHMILVRN